tara:strand:- start:721 stop:1353 length:633 start_codon:yes stop_codon:yes gene_type:complete
MDYLINHYENLYKKFEKSPLSLQHANIIQQQKRYEIISTKIKPHFSIIDFGCGFADFYKFLSKNKNYVGEYTGIEIVPSFINENKKQFLNNQKVNFINKNLLEIEKIIGVDYCVACGTFNNFIPNIEAKKYLQDSLLRLFNISRVGISFNLLSTYVDYKDSSFFYFDPTEVFDYCKLKLSPYVELKHDYILNEGGYPYEYTIHISRHSTI